MLSPVMIGVKTWQIQNTHKRWIGRIDFLKKTGILPTVAVSLLLYGCTTWTLKKRWEKNLDENYKRILRSVLSKSCKQIL